MLNEMGAHHFFYDACEPHFEVFQDCFLDAMRQVLNGGDSLDEEIERSWICVWLTYISLRIGEFQFFQNVRLRMGEGVEIQRANYLSQCLRPKEMEDIIETWKKVEQHGFRKAGAILCEAAFESYSDLLKMHHLKMALPETASKGSRQFSELSDQVMKVRSLSIVLYVPQKLTPACLRTIA